MNSGHSDRRRVRTHANTNATKVTYLEDFPALETELVIGGGFEIVLGDGLHGCCCELREPLGCGCLSGGVAKKNKNALSRLAWPDASLRVSPPVDDPLLEGEGLTCSSEGGACNRRKKNTG